MQPDASGYYRVFTARPDGSEARAVADGLPDLPAKHQGMPYWHPSGRYLLIAVQKPEWSGMRFFGTPDFQALPGFGQHDDLWLIAADSSRAWKLTDEPNSADQGVLVPVFSPDGKRVAWSSRQPGGKYALKVAEFAERPEPHLQNVSSYQPGGRAYYETGSFTSDSAGLLYASDQDVRSFWHSQIYRLDLATGEAARLTQDSDYNQHPTAVSTPGGDWIVYMSTREADRFGWQFLLGTDWWAMRADGSGVKRLTEMNVNRPDNPQSIGAMQVAGPVAVSPDGSFFLGEVKDNLIKQTGSIRVVHFVCP